MKPGHSHSSKSRRRSKSPSRGSHRRRRTAERFSQLIDSEGVEVCVGAANRKWILPKNLLCDASPFFRGALSNGFKEGRDQKLLLPEDNPEAFVYLVQYMYGNTIDHCPMDPLGATSDELVQQQKEYAWTMMLLYILAHKLLMTGLKNLAMDRFREVCRLGDPEPTPEEISEMLHAIPLECKFRNLLVQFVASTIQDLFQDMDAVQYDDEYFADTYLTCFDANRHFQLEVFYACSHGIVSNPFYGPDRLWHSV